MAAIFALSLVPAGALAQAPDDTTVDTTVAGAKSGVLGKGWGKITIANTKNGETYNVWRIFELASFADENPANDNHGAKSATNDGYDTQEAYSYVINEKVAGGTDTNPWYTFLTTYGPKGSGATTASADNKPFAVMSKNATTGNVLTEQEITASGAYFVIDSEPITIKDAGGATVSTYHAVRATENFRNAWDYVGNATSRADEGVSAGDDLSKTAATGTPANGNQAKNYNVVQDFAQAAVKYATDSGTEIAPNYVETGTGKPAEGGNSAVPAEVVVNGANTGAGGTDDARNWTVPDGATTRDQWKSEKVPLGWYLVGTSMGTLAALDTTNDEVNIYEKNDEPTIEKKVLKKGVTTAGAEDIAHLTQGTAEYKQSQVAAGATGAADLAVDWVDNTDADINDYVQFRTVITAQQGAKGYKLHDVMEKGLEFVPGTLRDDTTVDETATVSDRYKKDATNAYDGDYNLKVYLVHTNASGDKELYSIRDYETALSTNGGTTATGTAFNWLLKYQSGTNGTGDQNAHALTSSDGCDFEIEFQDADLAGYDATYEVRLAGRKLSGTAFDTYAQYVEVKDGDQIVVTYWARVKEDAAIWGSDAASGDASTIKDNGNPAQALDANHQQKTESDGNQRNTNATVLTYGNRSFTQMDKAEVTVYQFDIAKTNGELRSGIKADDADYETLAGAKFEIYKAVAAASSATSGEAQFNGAWYDKEDGAKALAFKKSDADYQFLGEKITAGTDLGTGGTRELVSSVDNPIHLFGLEEGYYLIYETEAPKGYNKLAHPIVVRVVGDQEYDGKAETGSTPQEGQLQYQTTLDSGAIDSKVSGNYVGWNAEYTAASGNAAAKYDPAKSDVSQINNGTVVNSANGGIHILNQTGQELPSTGGIGTTIFYVVGTVLVVGAGVMLVAKRRMGSEA